MAAAPCPRNGAEQIYYYEIWGRTDFNKKSSKF